MIHEEFLPRTGDIFFSSSLYGRIDSKIYFSMKKVRDVDNALQKQANHIILEIMNSLSEYTDDNVVSKFFLPDEISHACYVAAGAMSSVVYIPLLESNEIENYPLLNLYFIAITYGFQIFLKERSHTTNSAPYKFPQNQKIISKARQKVFKQAEKGKLTSTDLAATVISIFTKHMNRTVQKQEYVKRDRPIDEEKFNTYIGIALYWGYNFAKEVIIETKKD